MRPFYAVKFVSGIVSVFEWDAAEISTAISHPRIVGILRNLEAEGTIPAQREAEKLFAAGTYERTWMGRTLEGEKGPEKNPAET